jgi:hypothetical protein
MWHLFLPPWPPSLLSLLLERGPFSTLPPPPPLLLSRLPQLLRA